jgi:hypothetical protein
LTPTRVKVTFTAKLPTFIVALPLPLLFSIWSFGVEISSEQIKIRDLLDLRKNSMLTVNPEYQRAAVWKPAQEKKLVDSVMRRYPLPLFYFHHKVRSVAGLVSQTLEVIDGQQRINALYNFSEGAFRLFDPVKDDKAARFPNFIKEAPCPWAHCDFPSLPADLRKQFLDTEVFIVKIKTDVEDEARDLFIRLQAGLPLNAQEKRDAWPGGFTELVLRLGGKQEIVRYPGHEFFRNVVKRSPRDRGEVRQLCAQICMLFFERAAHGNWIDIGTQEIDDYYYRHLDFHVDAPATDRLKRVLDIAVRLFADMTSPKLKAYEAIHLVLLIDGLLDEYSKSWQDNFLDAYDHFKANMASAKKQQAGEYWSEFGAWTQTSSASARTIQRRHAFFVAKMLLRLQPVLLDPNRIYGELEREIVYYRDAKKCAVCDDTIRWPDLEIHHVEEHQAGGATSLENAAPVHKDCHPKGHNARLFRERWLLRKNNPTTEHTADVTVEDDLEGTDLSNSPSKRRSRFGTLPPDGTKCRLVYAGAEFEGSVIDRLILVDGISGGHPSFSAASKAVTNTSRNGWMDWFICLPGTHNWVLADDWRKSLGSLP